MIVRFYARRLTVSVCPKSRPQVDIAVTAIEVRHVCGTPLGLRVHCDGKIVAYSGDTEWTEALIEVGRDADLFIVESLSFEHRITQHLDYASFGTNAHRFNAKRIVLTHFGPEMLAKLGDAVHETAEDGLFMDI